jgi:hypothetical protein
MGTAIHCFGTVGECRAAVPTVRHCTTLQLPPAAVDEFYEHLPVLLEYLRRYTLAYRPCHAILRRLSG